MQKLLIICFITFLLLGETTAQTIYFSEDFENTDLTEWTLEDLWTVGDYSTLAGLAGGNVNNSSFLGFDDFSAGQNHIGGGRAISPIIDLNNATGELYLEITVKFRNSDQFFIDETFELLISKDGGTNWESIEVFDIKNWEKLIYDFSLYAGETIQIALEYSDGGGFNVGAAVDDIGISTGYVFTDIIDYTLTVDGGSLLNTCAQNIEYPITGLVMNNGIETINSFDIEVNTAGSLSTYSFNEEIESRDIFRYTIPELIPIGTSSQSLTVSLTNINGISSPDNNTSDNTRTINFEPIVVTEDKAILAEEGTGMWCSQCVRGTAYMDELSKRFGKHFAGVAVHNSDVLEFEEYDEALNNLGVLGFPTVVLNREELFNPDALLAPVIEFLSTPVIAGIDVGAREIAGDLYTSVVVNFNEESINTDYNVSVILTEDDLFFNSSSWNQWNSYSGSTTEMGGFELFPVEVPSKYWPYSHVPRALIGGFNGVNEITGNFTAGSSQSVFLEEYDINNGWNRNHMHIIAVLTDSDGTVINTISKKYYDALEDGLISNVEENIIQGGISIYPNPTNDLVNVDLNLTNSSDVSIAIYDLLGHQIVSKNYSLTEGDQSLFIDLSQFQSGHYFLQINTLKTSVTKKISKL